MSDAACAARSRETGGSPCGRIAWNQRLRGPAERVSPPRGAWIETGNHRDELEDHHIGYPSKGQGNHRVDDLEDVHLVQLWNTIGNHRVDDLKGRPRCNPRPPRGERRGLSAAGKRAVFCGPRGRKGGEIRASKKRPWVGAFFGKKKTPGSDLLSHGKARSSIGAGGFHCRVRNGFGWDTSAMTARRKYIRIIERREIRHSIH